jgi:hypothetical protein
MSFTSSAAPTFSPVDLSYAAALRGLTPRAPGATFNYAQIVIENVESILCLAASNPEGRFFGLTDNDGLATEGQNLADQRQVANISFLASPFERLAKEDSVLPALDMLVCDAAAQALSADRRDALFALAEKKVKPTGLFAYRYQAYPNVASILRFLVNELAPDMSVAQANVFLSEIKYLGSGWIETQPALKASLDQAIAKAVPDAFFAQFADKEPVKAESFATMEGLLPRGFSFVGDAVPASNYRELSTAPAAHAILEKCKASLFYEIVKDFAMQRLVRNDVWCRLPATLSSDLGALFGSFTYGMTMPRDRVPGSITVFDKQIDLTQPLFAGMIDLMTLLPMTIGDFLKHPNGKDFTPENAVEAMQVLIALGFAQPMRTSYQGASKAPTDLPHWALGYNAFHNVTPVVSSKVRFASKIVGGSVTLPARDALVLQAIGRVGLQNSAGAVFLEMQRIAKDPILANEVMQTTAPTPEMADEITKNTVASSLVRWYAYGLLAA